MQYSESSGNLLDVGSEYALAHCISVDSNMGAGIAVAFRRRYRGIQQYCLAQMPKVGDAILFQHKTHHVFNLITKQRYFGKPTYTTLRAALESMKAQIVEHDYKKLAMPRIGCGLDKLSWTLVRKIIQEVFGDLEIEILVVQLG